MRGLVGELQVGVLRYLCQRRQIEHTGDRISRGDQIVRRGRVEHGPLGCHHAGGEMSAGGMAVDADALLVIAPEVKHRGAHLLDDGGDRDRRAKIVADDRDRHAVRIRPLRHLAESFRIERAPPAAVNEHRQRRIVVRVVARKKIDAVARRRAIRQAQLRAFRAAAIGRGLGIPALENLRMLRHTGAVVIFFFVVDGHSYSPRSAARVAHHAIWSKRRAFVVETR